MEIKESHLINKFLPLNSIGSCGIIVILDLKSSTPIELISMLSIDIFPLDGSTNLNNDNAIVDFPDPVLLHKLSRKITYHLNNCIRLFLRKIKKLFTFQRFRLSHLL